MRRNRQTGMDKHYNVGRLLRFTAPSIAMMVFTSVYGIFDGFFVSNYAGEIAFSAVNFIMPLVMMLSSVGFMLGTGGSALVAKTRGEGDDEAANRVFSQVSYFALAVGVLLSIMGLFLVRPYAVSLGAEGEMLEIAVTYGSFSMISLTGFVLQSAFQVLFSTAGKPQYGFRITLAAGITNMVLDFFFVGVFGWGVIGAVLATNVSELFGGFASLIYFVRRNNTSYLRLGKPVAGFIAGARVIGRVCVNGSSEMMSSISMSLVNMLYNWQLLRMIGESGVAAYGVIMYVSLVFNSIVIGYSMGVSPLMSYQFGAQNRPEMRSLLKKSVGLVLIGGTAALVLAQASANVVGYVFVSYDADLFDLTAHAFRLYALAFPLMGFLTYASALFTSLNNGLISALIAFLRTLLFEAGSVVLLPLACGTDGIWLSVVVGDGIGVVLALVFLVTHYSRYFSDGAKRYSEKEQR